MDSAFEATVHAGLNDLFKANVDYKKFLGHVKTREAVECLRISARDSVSLPFNIDDVIIDQAANAVVVVLDQYKELHKNDNPLIVGAMANPVSKKRDREEVEAALRKAGIDPMTIASIVMFILQYAPVLIAAIKKLFGK